MNSKEKIIKDYDKIINYVIKDMHLGYKHDEIFDVGMIGFVRGLNTFDDTKGAKYSTYLYKCIKNEILIYLNNYNRKTKDITIVSLNTDIGDDTELQDLIGYDVDYEQNAYFNEMINAIKERMGDLTKKQYLIFSHLYGLNGFKEMTVSEIVEKYGFSRQSIHQIKDRTLNKMRFILNKYRNEEDLYDKKNR